MSLYVNCQSCHGQGHTECEACICKTCRLATRVECSKCKKGMVPCAACAATGKVAQKVLFVTRQRECSACNGSGKKICGTCDGRGTVICPVCDGKGRGSACTKCGSTNKVTCLNCKGEGKFEGEWLKSIKQMSVEKLRFEYDKKRFELTSTQSRFAQLDRKVDDIIQHYSVDAPLSGFWQDYESTRKRIPEIRSELEAIEQVLDSKWK
jgi:hypothetical protein